MTVERRFATSYGETSTNNPGIVLENDGTVWLVNPDGTRTQLPGGGGSSVHTRETLSGDSVLVSNGGQATLPWTTSAGPDTLLDISTPAEPVVLESGIYAIMGDTIQDDAMTVGGWYTATLTVDNGIRSDQVTSSSPPSNAREQFPQAPTLVLIRYLTPSDTIKLVVHNQDGVNDINFGQSGSIVQRIS